MRIFLSVLVATVILAGSWACSQDAGALRVYSSNGVRSVLQEMQPEIERFVGREVTFEFSTSRELTDRIVADEPFDVAVLTPALIDELVAAQKVIPETRTTFARVGVGVGSRAGAPVRSVSTLDELRETLLSAGSVAYGETGQSRRTNEASFEILGIVDEMRAKTRLSGPGEGPVLVADGEVELVLTLVSELLREPGVQFLGPFPPEVQGYIDFAAAVSGGASDPDAARALISFLSAPALVAALEAHGLEAIPP